MSITDSMWKTKFALPIDTSNSIGSKDSVYLDGLLDDPNDPTKTSSNQVFDSPVKSLLNKPVVVSPMMSRTQRLLSSGLQGRTNQTIASGTPFSDKLTPSSLIGKSPAAVIPKIDLSSFKTGGANNPYVEKVNPVKSPVDAMTKATNTANIINGVNSAVGGGLALYGLAQVDKMKAPTSLQAPTIEAKLIRDRGAAIATANKGEIDTQLNTAREGLLRRGRTDMLPTLVGKGMSAVNQSSAQIEQLRMGIEQANVGAENRVREINANSKIQVGQFNTQVGQQFNQFKAQLSGSILSAGIQNVSANLSGIAQNNYAAAMYKSDQEYKDRYMESMNRQSYRV